MKRAYREGGKNDIDPATAWAGGFGERMVRC
jgi:hypothetical protein